MVMPEMGLDELPMMPTMRLATVTKKKPKTTMRPEIRIDSGNLPGRFGRTASSTSSTTMPRMTSGRGMSFSVRLVVPLPPPRRSRIESPKLWMMVGRVFSSVITPAQATAPAPM